MKDIKKRIEKGFMLADGQHNITYLEGTLKNATRKAEYLKKNSNFGTGGIVMICPYIKISKTQIGRCIKICKGGKSK